MSWKKRENYIDPRDTWRRILSGWREQKFAEKEKKLI